MTFVRFSTFGGEFKYRPCKVVTRSPHHALVRVLLLDRNEHAWVHPDSLVEAATAD